MKAHGLARLGRDVEIRYAPSGDAVANLALAFTWGKKDQSGNRQTQWVEASLWGKRAEVLTPYLAKGSQVVAYLEDVHIETYEGRNGQGHKMVARVADLELVSAPLDGTAPALATQRQAPAPRPAPAPAGGGGASGFDDMEDDITFASSFAGLLTRMAANEGRKAA